MKAITEKERAKRIAWWVAAAELWKVKGYTTKQIRYGLCNSGYNIAETETTFEIRSRGLDWKTYAVISK